MNFLARRKLKKTVHLVRQVLRHALRMRADIAPAEDVAAVYAAEAELLEVWRARNWQQVEPACERAAEAAERLMPPRPFPKWRENVEVLVVAISLALACRTYFVQPFKIPTGSMQPTLNGITVTPQVGRTWKDRPPLNLVNLALFGERYGEVKAKATGRLEFAGTHEDQYAYRIGREMHAVRLTMRPDSPFINPAHSMHLHHQIGDWVKQGDVIASGRVRQGDHLFVNKVRYHFTRPQRGHIVVFDANYIHDRERWGIRPGTFYIKRLAGLAGETISIRDRHLVANGVPVTAPEPFERLLQDPRYKGYVPRPDSLLDSSQAKITVKPQHFLPLGDNTYSSLDGRYFGPVADEALVGPAFFVYWPLGPHWGPTR